MFLLSFQILKLVVILMLKELYALARNPLNFQILAYVVPTFFLLFSFTFLFEGFYYSVKEYRKVSVCCSSG